MTRKFILVGKDHLIAEVRDFLAWAEWMETADRTVKVSTQDDVSVSTVFLGLDHNFSGKGPPILFETMVFVAGEGHDQRRYATWEEAERGHDEMVRETFKPVVIERPHAES